MANIWREPIFDRTYSDVISALSQISLWKENHTHSADVVVKTDEVIINEGEVSVANDVASLKGRGVAYIEGDSLIMQLGIVYDLKGCLNLSDLTRIEDNISYLATHLNAYPPSTAIHTKEWSRDGLPTEADMKRIGKNIRSLFEGFYTPSGVTVTPDIMLSYEDINALERNLYLLKDFLDIMESSYIQSGTSKCGQTSRLPLRR